MSLLNDQLRQLLARYEMVFDGPEDEELIAVLDDNLSDSVKIKLSNMWSDIGCEEEEEYDEQG